MTTGLLFQSFVLSSKPPGIQPFKPHSCKNCCTQPPMLQFSMTLLNQTLSSSTERVFDQINASLAMWHHKAHDKMLTVIGTNWIVALTGSSLPYHHSGLIDHLVLSRGGLCLNCRG